MLGNHVHGMIKGLALHYLHQGTVADAVKQGQTGGVSRELLDCLPGMMFEVTSAAGAIFGSGRDFDEVVDEVTRRAIASGNSPAFGRADAATMVKLTMDFFEEISASEANDAPLPATTDPWYLYGRTQRPTSSSSGRRVCRS